MGSEFSKRALPGWFDRKTVTVAVICLAVGLFGHRLLHVVASVAGRLPHPRLPWLAPLTQGPATLDISDFESEVEMQRWKGRDVAITRVQEHASHGQWAARLDYPARQQAPSAVIEDALERGAVRSDWSSYSEIRFDLYNPQSQQERIILQLKDRDGSVYKQNVYLNPESEEPVTVPIAALHGAIRSDRITQFNLFRWEPDHAATFYLDHVRLIRAGKVESLQTPARLAQAHAGKGQAVPVAAGFVLGIADGTTKIFREPELFSGMRSTQVQVRLARNETEAFQVALYRPREPLTDVRIEASELTREDGQARLDSRSIRLRQVGYVETEKPDYPVRYVGWWPDPLVDASSFRVESGRVQPIWVTIHTTADTPPGHYRGMLTVSAAEAQPVQLTLEVTVWDFTLPVTSHLRTAFDFYPARLRRAYEEFLPEAYAKWKDRMGELQHRYFLDLVEHRLSPVWNVDVLNDPAFDQQIVAYLNRGLTAFGIGTRGGSFDNNWPADPSELDRVVLPYRDMAEYLRRRGWLDRAYIYTYDEPGIGDPKVAKAAEAVHWADPQLKNLVVVHELNDPAKRPEWWRHVDIVCVHNTAVTESYLDTLRQWGKEIWLYVSGPTPPYPTLVLDYPVMAARILPWMCWKARATGLLYWCVNFWTKDPWQDPANTKWGQNANGSLLYPGPEGPVDSIRLEALRDGMEDYEYLVLLQQAVARVTSAPSLADQPSVQTLLSQARRLLAIDPALAESMRVYSEDSAVLQRNRSAIAELIEQLERVRTPRDEAAQTGR